MTLGPDDVADILALLDGLPYDEVDLRTDAFHLVVRRDPEGAWTRSSAVLSSPTVEHLAVDGRDDGAAGDQEAAAAAEERADVHAVRAPMVGTFYRAPRPGADPFVDVGSRVRPDSVVGLVETMKLFNSVEAGVAGEVVEICVDNATFAEKDAVLMRIAPDGA